MAILKCELRVKLTSVTTERRFNGQMVVNLTGQHAETSKSLLLTLPVS